MHVGLLIFLLCSAESSGFVRHDAEQPRGILILAFYSLYFWFSTQKNRGRRCLSFFFFFGLPLTSAVFLGWLLSLSFFFFFFPWSCHIFKECKVTAVKNTFNTRAVGYCQRATVAKKKKNKCHSAVKYQPSPLKKKTLHLKSWESEPVSTHSNFTT